ncbi:MAG: choice-of-anchor D domain-containing protein [Acidobacteriaceae bacterium]|nr:choice-of-anchor D domain-containing protein [Acidobacteriaceae bacterium]
MCATLAGCGSSSSVASSSAPTAAAAATLSATTMTFSAQPVGTTSAAQTVTLTNSGSAPLNLTSIALSGSNAAEFSQTNNCAASLAAAATCTINVGFSPTASAAATASVSIAYNAIGSPQTVTLSGTVALPATTLSPTTLTFTPQAVGTTSAAQTITLTNSGAAPLTLTSIGITGTNSAEFSETSTCANTLAASASCSINVTFAPTASGSAVASISIADNASGSPQSVSLSGSAAMSGASLSPVTLAFASQPVGVTSAAQAVTLTDSGAAPLTLTGITLTGTNASEFTQTNNCPATLAVSASCTITVAFTAIAAGSASASISITDNASGSPQNVPLNGTATTLLSLTKVSSTEWDIANGPLAFQFNPTNFSIANLKVTLNGVTTNFLDATAGSPVGYSPFGHTIGLYNLYSETGATATGATTANYVQTANYIDVWTLKSNIVGTDPLAVENHWIIRLGDPGLHFYQVLRHTAADGVTSFGAATTNFFPSLNSIAQADGSTLYYAYNIGPNNPGVTNEGFPPYAFTQSILATGPGRQVQAETVDYTATILGTHLTSPGLDREFITKYNYSTYEQYHVAHGAVGAQNAFWWVVPSHETMIGGPTKQYLTTVQLEYESAHLGGTNVSWTAGEVNNRLFGPYYLHFNAFNAVNTTNDSLYAEAASTQPGCLSFYDTESTLINNGYTPSSGRGTLQATIASTGWSSSPTNNVVMLTDNNTYFQESSNGYQYWGYADANGNVTIPNVVPGTYRLSSYILGQWGLYHQDNVVIGSGTTTLTGLTFQPRNFSTYPPIWQIGIPDRSAHEFMNGHDANGRDVRDYLAIGNYWQLLAPNSGKVVYTVGTSDINTSWPFIQYKNFNPNLYAGIYNSSDTTDDGYKYITPAYVTAAAAAAGTTTALYGGANWEIHFTTTAAQLAQGSYVLISINMAATDYGSLQVRLNGKHKNYLLWYPLLNSDPDVRSGVAGYNNYVVFQFNTTDLNAAGADNVVTLYNTGAYMYDALKMEIGPNSANPATTGWPEYDWMYYNASDNYTQQSASAP